MVLPRCLQVLVAALALGLPAAALLYAVEVQPYRSAETVWGVPLPRGVWGFLLADCVRLCVAGGLGVVLLALLLERLGRAVVGPRSAALGAALVALGAGALHLVLRVNRLLLPEKSDPKSLAANAGIALAILVLAFVLARVLRAWLGGPWAGGRAPWVALVLLVLPAGAALTLGRGERDAGPDVLVVLIDVLGARPLGCYGYERPTSPHIDRFAEDAVLFENAISSSSFTKTSVSTLFTGVFPYNHGVYRGSHEVADVGVTSDVLGADFVTLAEGMRGAGLHTAAWIDNAHIRTYTGFGQGFDLFDDYGGSMHKIMSEYLPWQERWHDRVRSFTYLHFIDLHTPYNPPEPYLGKFGPTDAGLPELEYDEWTKVKLAINQGQRPFPAEDVAAYRARHDELLSFVDRWFGYLMQQLKEDGRYDDTLIVLLGDHGEAFMEHGFIEHSNVPYEEVIHVPMIVKLPGNAQAGRREDALVGLVDLSPTLLEYVGAHVPDTLDGRSFLDLLLDPQAEHEPRTIVAEYMRNVSIRTERWKYVHHFEDGAMLFDLSVDPGETRDCSEEYPEVAARMARQLEQIIEAREALGERETVELDEDTIEELKALGYI